jgi:hypothetical protein
MSDVWVFVLWSLWVAVIVCITTISVTNNTWKGDTVERGLAMYCPADGRWAWNGECGK